MLPQFAIMVCAALNYHIPHTSVFKLDRISQRYVKDLQITAICCRKEQIHHAMPVLKPLREFMHPEEGSPQLQKWLIKR